MSQLIISNIFPLAIIATTKHLSARGATVRGAAVRGAAVVGAAVEEEAPQLILVGVAALQRRTALTHLALLSPEFVESVLQSFEQVFTPTDL